MFRVSAPVRRLSITLIATISLGEMLIMLLLPLEGDMPIYIVAFLDVALLSLITVPVVIWTVSLPMNKNLLDLARSKKRASQSEREMLSGLNSIALARDNETGMHILRTQQYVRLISERLMKMGLYTNLVNRNFIERLVKIAPLHDVGKVGIPDNILRKPGSLSDSEMEVMRTHATIGENILAASVEKGEESEIIATAIKVAGGHHEKWDGSGYPRGLCGQDIPLEARIMALADVYDALVSRRAYKLAWEFEDACKEIESQRGVSFDPVIVDAFVAEHKNFEKIALKYQDPV